MVRYSIAKPNDLKKLCELANWFTLGSGEQFMKVLELNKDGTLEDVATAIWICTDDIFAETNREDILLMLKLLHENYECERERA